jgi:hypothetical protein
MLIRSFVVVFACADVAPRGREVEMQRAPAQREPERLPHGERRRRDDAAGRPAEPERAARRRRFDDPGAGPSHAPPAAAGVDFDDIRRRLETVLQDVPEGMWTRIQDERVPGAVYGGAATMAGHSATSSSAGCDD